MVSGRGIAAILIGATIAAVLFMPINSAVADNTGEVEVDDEELAASTGDWQELDGYDIVSDSETVEWYNDSSSSWETVSSGSDYEMDDEAGQIRTLSGGTIEDGDDVRVSYTYAATDGMTTAVVVLIPLFVALLILWKLSQPIMEAM